MSGSATGMHARFTRHMQLEQATTLHPDMRDAEANEELTPEVQQQLYRLLFQKRTVDIDNSRRSYVATTTEVQQAIRTLLQRRKGSPCGRRACQTITNCATQSGKRP